MDTITVDLKRAKRSLVLRTVLGWVCFVLTFGMYLFFYVFRIVRDNNVLMAIVVVASLILGVNIIATVRLPRCLKNALRSVGADGSVIIVNDDRYDLVKGVGFNIYDGPLKLRFLFGISFVVVQTDEKGQAKSKAYWCGFWSDSYCREKISEIFGSLREKTNLVREAKWDAIGESLSTTPFELKMPRTTLKKSRVNNAILGYGYTVIVLLISLYEFYVHEVFLAVVLIVIAVFFALFVTYNQYLYSVNMKNLVHDLYLSETEYKINGYSFDIGSISNISVYMNGKTSLPLKGNIAVRPPVSHTDSGFYMEIVLDSSAKSRYWLGTFVDSDVAQIMGSAEYVWKMRRTEPVK